MPLSPLSKLGDLPESFNRMYALPGESSEQDRYLVAQLITLSEQILQEYGSSLTAGASALGKVLAFEKKMDIETDAMITALKEGRKMPTAFAPTLSETAFPLHQRQMQMRMTAFKNLDQIIKDLSDYRDQSIRRLPGRFAKIHGVSKAFTIFTAYISPLEGQWQRSFLWPLTSDIYIKTAVFSLTCHLLDLVVRAFAQAWAWIFTA